MEKKIKEQNSKLMEIVEVFNHSLIIGNLINDYIIKNKSIQYNKSLLKKANKACQLISEIHQYAHGKFLIEYTPIIDKKEFKCKMVEKIIHKHDVKKK